MLKNQEQSKHTPGPWYVGAKRTSGLPVIARPCAFVVAEVTFPNSPESHHNARLIAAAPEMLEALRQLVSEAWSMNPPPPHFEAARALLARLDGGK